MNKKIVVLLLVVFCLASTIILSMFGKVPEDESRIAVQTIEFVDSKQDDGKCLLNSEGYKVIYIERGSQAYQLEYQINPSEATDLSVSFQIVSGNEFAEVSDTGLVFFTVEATITVKIYSNPLDFKSDVVILDFSGNQSTIIPDDEDPFA